MSTPPQHQSPAIAELAGIILAEQPLDAVPERVTKLAKATVARVDQASITLVRGEKAYTAAFTDEVALRLDERQYEAGYGPCLDAAASGEVITIRDTAHEPTYPEFAWRAHEAGVRHTLSVGLPVATATIGALNLYGRRTPGAFDDDAVQDAVSFAGYAAVALGNASDYAEARDLAEQMRQAMATRAVIQQAKGILMRDNRCTPEEAFEMLRTASNRSNRKLRDIAQSLVLNTQRGG
jgi:GAF domain-containing protein